MYLQIARGPAHAGPFELLAEGQEQHLLGLAVADGLLHFLPLFNFLLVADGHAVLDEGLVALLLDDLDVSEARVLDVLGLALDQWLVVPHTFKSNVLYIVRGRQVIYARIPPPT